VPVEAPKNQINSQTAPLGSSALSLNHVHHQNHVLLAHQTSHVLLAHSRNHVLLDLRDLRDHKVNQDSLESKVSLANQENLGHKDHNVNQESREKNENPELLVHKGLRGRHFHWQYVLAHHKENGRLKP